MPWFQPVDKLSWQFLRWCPSDRPSKSLFLCPIQFAAFLVPVVFCFVYRHLIMQESICTETVPKSSNCVVCHLLDGWSKLSFHFFARCVESPCWRGWGDPGVVPFSQNRDGGPIPRQKWPDLPLATPVMAWRSALCCRSVCPQISPSWNSWGKLGPALAVAWSEPWKPAVWVVKCEELQAGPGWAMWVQLARLRGAVEGRQARGVKTLVIIGGKGCCWWPWLMWRRTTQPLVAWVVSIFRLTTAAFDKSDRDEV